MTSEQIKANIEKAIANHDEQVKKNRDTFVAAVNEKARAWAILKMADLPGVVISDELPVYELSWNTWVDVKDVRMFPTIQRLLGYTFEHHGKEPIGDGRQKKIRVTMAVKNHPELNYRLQFRYERKLTDNDKCKVVTQTRRETRVVCTR